MSWSKGSCPTVFGDFDRTSINSEDMAEVQLAIYERDQGSVDVTGGNVVSVVNKDFYDRKPVRVDDPDTPVQTILGIRQWLYNHAMKWGDPSTVAEAYMRPYFNTKQPGTFSTWDEIWDEFTNDIFGYSDWKVPIADIKSGRVPITSREIEEIRKIIEALEWAPKYVDWIQFPGTVEFGQYGNYTALAYNDNGNRASSSFPPPALKFPKGVAWAALKANIGGTLKNPYNSSKNGHAGGGLETRWFEDYVGSDDYWLMLQSGSSPFECGGWNQRAKITFLANLTGDTEFTFIDGSHEIWSISGYTAEWSITSVTPPSDWYNWGSWPAAFHTRAVAGQIGTQWSYTGTTQSLSGATHHILEKGFEATRGTWTEWDALSSPDRNQAIRSFGASCIGIWERGSFAYGTP